MKRTIICVALLAAAAISAAAQCSEADKKALESFDRAWSEANRSGDKALMATFYADDFYALPGNIGKAASVDNAYRAWEREKANPQMADKVTHEHYRISCTANSALITHRNTIWTPNGTGGKPESFYTRSIHSLEKRAGKWQVVSNASGGGLDEYDAIWYLEQDWNDAIKDRNKEWFEKNYAADFSGVSSDNGQVMSRKADIDETMNSKSKLELVETTNMDIRMDGNAALVTGIFRMKGVDDKGKPFDRRTRYTDTWVKRDGRWQAWSSHGTTISSGTAVATN